MSFKQSFEIGIKTVDAPPHSYIKIIIHNKGGMNVLMTIVPITSCIFQNSNFETQLLLNIRKHNVIPRIFNDL